MVALIDDDMVQLHLYRVQLTQLGAVVSTFTSGTEFLKLKDHGERGNFSWDFIVVDYMMPGLNGIETIDELGADTLASTKVFLFSGTSLSPKDEAKVATMGLELFSKCPTVCATIFQLATCHQDRIVLYPPSADTVNRRTSVVLAHRCRTETSRTAVISPGACGEGAIEAAAVGVSTENGPGPAEWLRSCLLSRVADPRQIAMLVHVNELRDYGVESGLLVPSRNKRKPKQSPSSMRETAAREAQVIGTSRHTVIRELPRTEPMPLTMPTGLRNVAAKRMRERTGKRPRESSDGFDIDFGNLLLNGDSRNSRELEQGQSSQANCSPSAPVAELPSPTSSFVQPGEVHVDPSNSALPEAVGS